MKGIILAGGKGTRLYPSTISISKSLIPIYDKPMIYYPLSVLMLAGIREILIISTPEHLPLYQKLLGSGERFGIKLSYMVQDEPRGLADAFMVGEEFIGEENVCLMLGDNIFYGHNLTEKFKEAASLEHGGVVCGYYVDDPSSFGVAEIKGDKVVGVQEKPDNPRSNYAIPGIYFFDNRCIEFAKNAIPSARGEIEITSVMEPYINEGSLKMELLGRGTAWLDTGTHESLIEASSFVHTIEKRQGLKIACLEEIAYLKDFINLEQLENCAEELGKSEYSKYLKKLVRRIKEENKSLKLAI